MARLVAAVRRARILQSGLLVVLLLFGAGSATAATLGFESLANGEEGPFLFLTPDADVSVSGSANGGGIATNVTAFDTDPSGPNLGGPDEDLLTGDPGAGQDMALIVQNNVDDTTQTVPGTYDTPNDDPQGGLIRFIFSVPVTALSVELIDINGNGPADVILIDGAGLTRTYTAPEDWTGDVEAAGGLPIGIDLLDLTITTPQAGVGPGGPATAVTLPGFDPDDVVQIDVVFDGSAALDNLTFIPEPGSFGLVALGLAGLAALRPRRR